MLNLHFMAKNKTTVITNVKIPLEDLDVFGLTPVGKAVGRTVDATTKAGLKGAEKLLSLTCKPLLEELGLILRDKLSNYRLNNIIKTLEKAGEKLIYDIENSKLTINPRVAYQIVESASMIDDDNLQDMWAGLFAASCNEVEDDQNIIFIEILKQLTSSQVHLLNYICQHSSKIIDTNDLPAARKTGFLKSMPVRLTLDLVLQNMRTGNYTKAHMELSNLFTLGLLSGLGIPTSHVISAFERGEGFSVMPNLLLFQLYVKCQGSKLDPLSYFEPQVKNEIYDKLIQYVNIQKDSILETLYKSSLSIQSRRIQSMTKFNICIENKSEEPLDLTTIEKSLRAWSLISWRSFDFEETYKVVTFQQQQIGTYSFQLGFTRVRVKQ